MKKILLATVALVALGATAPALAADLAARPYTKAPPPVMAPIYNWTGFYIGGHVGAAFGNDNTFNGLVVGGNNNAVSFPNGFAYSNDQRGLGSVTGRIGYTWGPALLYVKGGYAYSDNREPLVRAGVPQAFAFDHNHRDGYTVGAGLEYMFAQNWSAKAEYQYYNFGRTQFVTPVDLAPFGSFRNDEHTVKVGLNYRFNFGNFGGPVVGRY